MPRFAANLSTMYGEHAFVDRFAAAHADGFTAVEAQGIAAWPVAELRARLDAHGLKQVLFNAPAGNADRGERGIAALPERRDEFRRGLASALEYARILACPCIHVMSGIVPADADRARHRATLVENLIEAAPLAAQAGVTLLIEPINPRDIPGYFLNFQADAHAICADVGAANVKVQMDLYHCQIVEGDLATRLRRYIAGAAHRVGHIQIAGVPERHEPDSGEVNYPWLFDLIDSLGYDGWIGCEYRPRGTTSAGLGWMPAKSRAARP